LNSSFDICTTFFAFPSHTLFLYHILDTLKNEELHGSLKTHELRINENERNGTELAELALLAKTI